MLTRSFALLLFAVVCFASAGCNVVRVTLNTPLVENDVAFIVPGQTTLAEVINKLGAPDSLTDSRTGVVATYRFLDVKYSRVNFGWLLKPWSPVDPDMILSRTGFGADAFEVLYDTRWIVTDHAFLRRLAGPRFNPNPF